MFFVNLVLSNYSQSIESYCANRGPVCIVQLFMYAVSVTDPLTISTTTHLDHKYDLLMARRLLPCGGLPMSLHGT